VCINVCFLFAGENVSLILMRSRDFVMWDFGDCI
jgi:hypothetical protein